MSEDRKIVGNCPKCGAPIYLAAVTSDDGMPANIYTCECRNKKGDSGQGFVKHGNCCGGCGCGKKNESMGG